MLTYSQVIPLSIKYKTNKMSLIKKPNRNNLMKTQIMGLTFLVLITILGCCKETVKTEDIIEIPLEDTVYGKWEITSGYFTNESDKYVIINDDNSIDILSEDELGFKRIHDRLKIKSANEIGGTSRFTSRFSYTYSLNDNSLNIIRVEDDEIIILSRGNDIPNRNSWIKTLTIKDQGAAPWNLNIDIGFDGANILFANSSPNENIALVNPSTITSTTMWETTSHTLAIEFEKQSSSTNPMIFLSSMEEAKIFGKNLDDAADIFQSIELGTTAEIGLEGPAIRGLASVGSNRIWVSNANSRELYLYDFSGSGEILKTIQLPITPYGLDFQSGFLYVCDGQYLHKCQTEGSFEVIESYKIPGYLIYGVSFDGRDFWVNADTIDEERLLISSIAGSSNTLIKTNLSN